jgi:hypothetical protein
MRQITVLFAFFIITLASFAAPLFPEGAAVLGERSAADPAKFTFAILGDRTGGTPEEWPVFDRAVDEINLLRPDFVIMVGDMIQGYDEDLASLERQWAEFKEHAGRLDAPLVMIPGNHDISAPPVVDWYKERVGATYFSFGFRGCHFLLLNNMEHWESGGAYIGEEQVRFALEDLEKNAGARHTFVFIHMPAWQDGGNPEWTRIEEALADRPHTLFAGHKHRLSWEEQAGNDRIVVSATKGVRVDDPDPVPELGRFPHFTMVTVDNNTPHIALVKPGAVFSRDIAPRALADTLRQIIDVQTPGLPAVTGDGWLRPVRVDLANDLDESIRLEWEVDGLEDGRWRLASGEPVQQADLSAGGRQSVELPLVGAADILLPMPRLRMRASWRGVTVSGVDITLPLYPEEALRFAPEWRVAGPFDAGLLPSTMPDDWRDSIPAASHWHGPEKGYRPGDTFPSGDGTVGWQDLTIPEGGELGFANVAATMGVPSHQLAYALCGVHAPDDRTVYARLRVDDYAQVMVNEVGVDGGQLYRTRRDTVWLALPLRAGWNTVVVKTLAITGGWSYRLLFADPAGELAFAPNPPLDE